MTDQVGSGIDVIMEEQEDSNKLTESDLDDVSISASQVGPTDVMVRIQPASSSTQRPSSALTVENLRLHEQTVAQEEKSLSRHGSAQSSHRPTSRGSLGPVRTPGRASPIRIGSGKANRTNIIDAQSPGVETRRTGSGKPLPPIGGEQNEEHVGLEMDSDAREFAEQVQTALGLGAEKQKDFLSYDQTRLSVSREAQDDGETVTSFRSARTSARSERSVSFRDDQESGKTKKSCKSPAVREVNRMKLSDGTEKISISCATETEWSWLEALKFLGKTEEELTALSAARIRAKTPTRLPAKSSLSNVSRASNVTEGDLLQSREGSKYMDEEEAEDGEEEGEEAARLREEASVPPLDLDSESEFSDDEFFGPPSDLQVPNIGPPRIIKYQRESEQVPISKKYVDAANVVGKKLDIDLDDFDSTGMENERETQEARIKGSRDHVRHQDQDQDRDQDRDQDQDLDRNQDQDLMQDLELRVKESRSYRSRSMMSDSSGRTPPLSTVGVVCEYCEELVKPFPTLEMQKTMDPVDLYCCKDYQDLVEYTIENTPLSQHPSDDMIDIAPHAPHGSKQARRAAKERAAQRMRDREMARQRAAGTNQANFYALQVARQMKTINYSLSSQRCLDEGWTVRPPTPEDDDKNKKPVYVPEPTTPQLPMIFKMRRKDAEETPIVRKLYRSGHVFMIMFEDGTGAVFYPSGALAILITSAGKNQFAYYVQSDAKANDAKLLAVFEPNGRGTCYHGNGNIKLNINQFGGIFTDHTGTIKKRWSWKDEDTHTKTPPFQPICFSLNQQISIRCMTQDQIFFTFNCELQTCRFNAGVKLKLVDPDHVPPKEINEDMLYISEVRTYVQLVLDHIFNQKNFSRSPKLENLRPSLKIRNTVIRNERLKRKVIERKIAKKGGPVVTVN